MSERQRPLGIPGVSDRVWQHLGDIGGSKVAEDLDDAICVYLAHSAIEAYRNTKYALGVVGGMLLYYPDELSDSEGQDLFAARDSLNETLNKYLVPCMESRCAKLDNMLARKTVH